MVEVNSENTKAMTIFIQSFMKMMGLEPTVDVEIGRQMVREKIVRDGITEKHLQALFEKVVSEMAKSGKSEFSSICSQ